MKVSPEELMETSNQLRGLISEFYGALDNYRDQTMANTGAGGWWGDAARANSCSTDDIHQAQSNLNARWGSLCDKMDSSAASYIDQEAQNAARAASVAL